MANFLTEIFSNVADLAKSPETFLNDDGQLSITRLIFPGYRKQKVEEVRAAEELRKAQARVQAASAVKSIADMFNSSPTDTQQAGIRQVLESQGFDSGMLAPLARGATESRKKTRQAAKALPAEAGITPEMARVMPLEDVSQVAQQGSQAKFTRGTQYQQAALTQANQANQAALTRQTQEMRQQGQVQSAKQIAKAKARIGRKGERVEGRDAVTFLKEYQKDAAYQALPMPQKAAINAAIRTGGKAAQTAAEDVAKMAGGEAGTKINIVNPGTVVNELRKEIAAGENALSGLAQIRELAETDPQAFQNPISALSYVDRMAETFGVNVSDANERRQAVITAAESSFNDYMLTIGGTTVAAGLMDQLRKTWVNAGDNDVQALVKVRAAEKRIRAANTLRTQQIAGLMSEKQLEQALRDNAEEFASELEQIEDESELDVTDEMDLTDEEKAEAARYGIPTE